MPAPNPIPGSARIGPPPRLFSGSLGTDEVLLLRVRFNFPASTRTNDGDRACLVLRIAAEPRNSRFRFEVPARIARQGDECRRLRMRSASVNLQPPNSRPLTSAPPVPSANQHYRRKWFQNSFLRIAQLIQTAKSTAALRAAGTPLATPDPTRAGSSAAARGQTIRRSRAGCVPRSSEPAARRCRDIPGPAPQTARA